MSVTESARRALFNRVEEVLGAEAADTLMSLVPPVGWADVATKHDLRLVEERLDRFEHRFDRLDAKVDTLSRSFTTWLLASQASVIAAVGGMLLLT